MNPDEKFRALEARVAAQAEAAKRRSEKARKKAREAGRVPVNLILSERSRRVLGVLAGEHGTKSAAVDHLCDQVLIPGDPGFVEARDGLVGSRLDVPQKAGRWLLLEDAPIDQQGNLWGPWCGERVDFLGVVRAYDDGGRFGTSGSTTSTDFTHWHPLPAAPDNPTKTIAVQGKTGDNAVKKAAENWNQSARDKWLARHPESPRYPDYLARMSAEPAKRLTPGRANPKQIKVKR